MPDREPDSHQLPESQTAEIGELFRSESGRILATLIRVLGDFDRAEEAMQDAFATALETWPVQGIPREPRAWIIATARNRAWDQLRRAQNFERKRGLYAAESPKVEPPLVLPESSEELGLADDRLRLIFTCCHPALAPDAQVALTLKTLCGLQTEEIARAFLVPVPTLAQRLVRAKAKIRNAGVPYQVPASDLLPERLAGVAATVYLLFNEGYAATAGPNLLRHDLSREAIRLGSLLVELMPEQSELRGLLALMLLHDARRDTRLDAQDELVLLADQDRSRWDRAAIARGLALVRSALRTAPPGPYALQAAIAACHASALRAADTDWGEIAALYALLARVQPSPVVRLNHAVAIAMRDGAAAGLERLDALAAEGSLAGHHLLPAARADLFRRSGRYAEAAVAYTAALELAGTQPERRFLERRRAEVLRQAEPTATDTAG